MLSNLKASSTPEDVDAVEIRTRFTRGGWPVEDGVQHRKLIHGLKRATRERGWRLDDQRSHLYRSGDCLTASWQVLGTGFEMPTARWGRRLAVPSVGLISNNQTDRRGLDWFCGVQVPETNASIVFAHKRGKYAHDFGMDGQVESAHALAWMAEKLDDIVELIPKLVEEKLNDWELNSLLIAAGRRRLTAPSRVFTTLRKYEAGDRTRWRLLLAFGEGSALNTPETHLIFLARFATLVLEQAEYKDETQQYDPTPVVQPA